MKDRFPISNNKCRYRYYKRPNLRDAQNDRSSVFVEPGKYQVNGDVRLGFINNTKMVFSVLKSELVKHLAVYGSSGSGKSSFLRVFLIELLRIGIPFLVFDTSKYGTRFLKHYTADLMILRAGKEFHINPLYPSSGVSIVEHLMVFSEITTEIFGLRTASKLYLLDFLQKYLFPKGKTYSQSDFPTLHDLNRKLEERLRERIPINERGYINSIHSKIKAICVTLKDVINVRTSIPVKSLLRFPICIELLSVRSSEIKYWLISLIMAEISLYRESCPMAFGDLRHFCFLDEASSILGNHMKGESFTINCIRRLREYGEGIGVADQCVSSIIDIVKNNTYITIGMSQMGQRDKREMISVLGLDDSQAAVFNLLDVGQGIVRLGGRFPFPQLITFPFVKPMNLSEKKLDEINANDQRIKKLLSKVKPVNNSENKYLAIPQGIPQYTNNKEPVFKTDPMLEKAKGILLDIYNRFDVPSTQRAKDFSLSGSSADKIFKYIEREQLAEAIKLNLSGMRGGISKYFGLMNKGYEAISKDAPKRSGGIGEVHFFLEKYLKKHLPEKGFLDLEIEKNIAGKRIDVFGKYDGLKIGIEICVSTIRTEIVNIQKDVDKCDVLIITTPDKKTKEKLNKELLDKIENYKNVKVCIVHELLNRPENIIKTI